MCCIDRLRWQPEAEVTGLNLKVSFPVTGRSKLKLKGSVTNENDYQLSPTPFFFLVCLGFREAGFAGKVLILWV